MGLISRLLSKRVVAPEVRDDAHQTDWVAGASAMIRREVFEDIGLLDEDYFLYFEETYLCLQARRVGWTCFYVPASRVIHLVGQATGVTNAKQPPKRMPRYWFESRRRYFHKNHGLIYTWLAGCAWLAGFAVWRARVRVQGKVDATPQRFVRDFIRTNFPAPWAKRRLSCTPTIETTNAAQATTPTGTPRPAQPLPAGDRNSNPSDIGIFKLLAEDLRTHDGNPFEQGFWAVAVHRLGNWRMGLPRLLRPPVTIAYRILFKLVELTCGITLPYTTRLGRRVRIWHHGGMILHARSIGNDVHIRHNTTFGVARRNHNLCIPVIEDGVDIGCGVCVLGDIRLGSDCVIGANATVLNDIPPGAVAVGTPARVVSTRQPLSEIHGSEREAILTADRDFAGSAV